MNKYAHINSWLLAASILTPVRIFYEGKDSIYIPVIVVAMLVSIGVYFTTRTILEKIRERYEHNKVAKVAGLVCVAVIIIGLSKQAQIHPYTQFDFLKFSMHVIYNMASLFILKYIIYSFMGKRKIA